MNGIRTLRGLDSHSVESYMNKDYGPDKVGQTLDDRCLFNFHYCF